MFPHVFAAALTGDPVAIAWCLEQRELEAWMYGLRTR